MSELKAILGATDQSAPARRAMARAALVSRETSAQLELVQVVNLALLARIEQLANGAGPALIGHIIAAEQARLDTQAASLQQHYGISIRADVVSGPLIEQLILKAGVLSAGLLVCGSKGGSMIRHAVLGSTATRLLNKTRCPLLVVKQPAREPYRRLLVPVDFSPSSLLAVRHALAIAPGAQLVLLHVFEVPCEGHLQHAGVDSSTINEYRRAAAQSANDGLSELVAGAGLKPNNVEMLVLHGDPRLRIVEQELEQDCDLIVMGKHGQSPFEDLLLGSVTEHVLAHSQVDVLVSPEVA
jgi:nucleotide-binding universal stress UspA family protein